MENLWKLMPLLLIFGAFMVCMLLIDRKSLNIKSKTVGDGQHGSASFATPKEIDAAFQRVRYEPQVWRRKPPFDLPQGIIIGCNMMKFGKKKTVTAIVEEGDVHALMIGAAGVGKTAKFLYPNLEYCCASGMSFVTTDTKGDLLRSYAPIAKKYYGNVLLMGNSETTSPFTVGILHKYIVIPAIMINALDEEEIEFVLSHECYHASQNDVGRKVLMIVLNCLNWFNPLFYFLKDNLSAWMEIACDEAVTERFDGRQKRKYAALIIKSLELENIRNKSHLYCVCYSGNNVKHYKRRIVEIMGEKKKNGLQGKVFVSALAVFSLTCSNVVAKAADIPVNMMFSNNVQVAKLGEIEEVQSDDMMIDTKIGGKDHSDLDNFVRFDVHNTKDTTYDIMYNDDIKAISNQPQDQIKPQHAHQIVDITLKEHKKNSDGSCKTTYYEGRKCKVCGAIWKGDIIQIVIKPKCPH